ncbi:MAG: GlcG/HbpS family heme-binding protein [Burkholderiales bacterium]
MKNKSMLTLGDVKKIVAAAEAEALKNNWVVAIAVLDDGGHPLAISRLDGATPLNVEVAMSKARTSALSGRSSKMFEDRVAAGRLSMLNMPLLPLQGGLPIIVDKQCIGSVGVSGVQSQEDEQIAKAGIDSLGI